MTLSEWASLHRSDLVAEPPDKNLIAQLRAVADRELRDAETVESCDGRLGHAHSACLAIAAAARRLRDRLSAWLAAEHPNLLPE